MKVLVIDPSDKAAFIAAARSLGRSVKELEELVRKAVEDTARATCAEMVAALADIMPIEKDPPPRDEYDRTRQGWFDDQPSSSMQPVFQRLRGRPRQLKSTYG